MCELSRQTLVLGPEIDVKVALSRFDKLPFHEIKTHVVILFQNDPYCNLDIRAQKLPSFP